MTVLIGVALGYAAVLGTAVVLSHDPARQAATLSMYSLVLVFLLRPARGPGVLADRSRTEREAARRRVVPARRRRRDHPLMVLFAYRKTQWFRKIQQNNQKAGDQGKQMLAARLASEGG